VRDSKGTLLQCTCNIQKTDYDLKECPVHRITVKNQRCTCFDNFEGQLKYPCPVHGVKENTMEKGKLYHIDEIARNEFEKNLDFQLRMIREFLIEKNKAYGNSALNPIRIFSKADTKEQLNVRLDDKLSRLCRGKEYPGDDDELDILGYLILKRMA